MTDAIDWQKCGGLLPVIVQDADDGRVLMLGYMNRNALAATRNSGLVTFFSRSRQRLWLKGETSGHRLAVVAMSLDCDGDALLIQARPAGPTCHTGAVSCFAEAPAHPLAFLRQLEQLIGERLTRDDPSSYTFRLAAEGVRRVAQKVGEEGIEVALAGVAGDSVDLTEEAADLVYHLLLLLRVRGQGFGEVVSRLEERHHARISSRIQPGAA